MIIRFLQQITNFNEICMEFLMKFVQFLHVPEFLQEAVAESINLIPFLFLIFLFIEIFENYFSEKIEKLSLSSRIWGPFVGSCLASIPQCGFSVIATMLYIKRFITLGTLIAIYIATSDEAIPILLVHPESFSVIIPVILTKIGFGMLAGYIVDFIFKTEVKISKEHIEVDECGCCHNEIHSQVTNLFIHPLKHCFNVFIFILIVNCCLDFAFSFASDAVNNIFNVYKPLQIVLASFVGLIPNCATSVLIVMLYLKHVISFGALIAGLSTNAGLGLLVLFQNNENKKECLKIVVILLVIAIIAGITLQILL
ncbi:arsenic efflux protein [bacterium]|nr:arsenic efflux protein [bacterium]